MKNIICNIKHNNEYLGFCDYIFLDEYSIEEIYIKDKEYQNVFLIYLYNLKITNTEKFNNLKNIDIEICFVDMD